MNSYVGSGLRYLERGVGITASAALEEAESAVPCRSLTAAMAPLPRGTPVTINGLTASPQLNGATGFIDEPSVEDDEQSRLVVRVSFPGGQRDRMIRVKPARVRAVARAPEYSRAPMTPLGLDVLFPVVQDLAGPRAVRRLRACAVVSVVRSAPWPRVDVC